MKSSAPFFATDGTATTVDWNEYSLTLEQAVDELHNGNNILALPFPDYSTDDWGDLYPDAELLEANHFYGKPQEYITNYLSSYDKYGVVKNSKHSNKIYESFIYFK